MTDFINLQASAGAGCGERLLRLCSLALLLIAAPAFAQPFSFGVIGGIPVTNAFSAVLGAYGATTTYDRQYIIGPTAEIHLPFHLSVEVDALYRRNGFVTNYSVPLPITPATSSTNSLSAAVNDWQFPILAKYEFAVVPLLRPFVSGGLVYRHTGANTNNPLTTFNNPNSAGIAIGGGIALKVGPLRLAPQVRYTHWPSPPLTTNLYTTVTSNSNQADFLVAFTF
jgi:hypothetical protein